MRKTVFAVLLLSCVFILYAYAEEKSEALFPALHPGISQDEAKAFYPKMSIGQGSPKGAAGFTLSDNSLYKGIRLLFVDGKLALLTGVIKEKKFSAVVEAAKKTYGEPVSGSGTYTYEFKVNGYSLQIIGDEDDESGKMTFVDPEAMKKIGQ